MLDSDAVTQRVEEILVRNQGREGPLLPILLDVQAEFGFVPEAALPVVAEALRLTRAEVHGVMSFYHDFRTRPAGRHVVKICRAESCQARGADALAAHARSRLGIDWHETTENGAVTLEPVFCLGLCAIGPAALVDSKPRAALDTAAIDKLAEDLQ